MREIEKPDNSETGLAGRRVSRRNVLRAAGFAGIGLALGINRPAAAVPVSPPHDVHSRSGTSAERTASSNPTAILSTAVTRLASPRPRRTTCTSQPST